MFVTPKLMLASADPHFSVVALRVLDLRFDAPFLLLQPYRSRC